MNPQAEELNSRIAQDNPPITDLLSEKGKAIFFPAKGILAQTADARGTQINATIGAGIEDNGSPIRLASIEKQINLEPKDVFPYAPSFGLSEFRNAWLDHIRTVNPSLKGLTSLPVVTNGITHALSIAGYLFVNPGEKILITDKIWGNYRLIFEHGYSGVISPFNTFKNNAFDVDALQHALDNEEKKIILLLNFPNNPTGYTPTEKEGDMIIAAIVKSATEGKKIVVLCDDAYFGLIYEKGVYPESLFSKLADAHENILAVKLDGATKEHYVWGLRVGCITFATKGITETTARALEAKASGAIRGNISNVSRLSQSLVVRALTSPTYPEEKQQKFELLKSRANKVKEVLKEGLYNDYFKALPFNSGYFMCIQLKESLDAEEMRQKLLKDYSTGVISLPGNIIRIAFSSVAAKDIPKLFENIGKACGMD